MILHRKNLVYRGCLSVFLYCASVLALAESVKPLSTESAKGEALFRAYCVLCHGEHGKGDGRLSAIVNDPSPANLTLSQKNLVYVENIISLGGEALSRSPQMPAWQSELGEGGVKAVAGYAFRLRSDAPENEMISE